MHAFPWSSQRTLTLIMIVLLMASGSLVPLPADPVAAQPLCLNGTIWDAEEEACVPQDPSPTPTEEQAEPSPTEAITIDESEGDDENGEEDATDSDEPTESTGEEMAPTPASDLQERAGEGSASLEIWAYTCPSYSDPVNLYEEALPAACRGFIYHENVSYQLEVGGTSLGSGTSRPEYEGYPGPRYWSDIPAGFAEVTIAPPGGYRNPLVVECYRGGSSPYTRRFADTSGTNNGITGFDLQITGNEFWLCFAYFQEQPTGTIRLEVWRCPDGTNIYGTGPDTLQASCTASMSDIEFILLHNPDGVYHAIATGSTGAVFYPLGEGTGNVRMAPPAGIGLPNVYCETTGPQGQTLSTYDWVYVSIDASFEVSIPHDAYIYCDVFVVNGGIPVEQPVRDSTIAEGMPPISASASPPVLDDSE